MEPCFTAIDFETADHGRDSACAVGIVRVEGNQIVARKLHFIRPPRPQFVFTHIHGITWQDVQGEPAFKEVWPALLPIFKGAQFVAAHNASFDQGVLRACCNAAGLGQLDLPFVCTMKLARRLWGMYPTKLSDVCRSLEIPLNHHEALSDAEACAKIVIQAGPKIMRKDQSAERVLWFGKRPFLTIQ